MILLIKPPIGVFGRAVGEKRTGKAAGEVLISWPIGLVKALFFQKEWHISGSGENAGNLRFGHFKIPQYDLIGIANVVYIATDGCWWGIKY